MCAVCKRLNVVVVIIVSLLTYHTHLSSTLSTQPFLLHLPIISFFLSFACNMHPRPFQQIITHNPSAVNHSPREPANGPEYHHLPILPPLLHPPTYIYVRANAVSLNHSTHSALIRFGPKGWCSRAPFGADYQRRLWSMSEKVVGLDGGCDDEAIAV